ncbi:protein kinase domain-containing protein [Sorangium sp. So ce1389]|uniref:serine/threonine-protein kinase n=1 Tax=Sorangium sp. So ce1389 TaxID=3133336 RepID=UPI003F60E2DC
MAELARHADPDQARQAPPERPTRRCPACGVRYPLDFLVCPIDATALELQGVTATDPMVGELLAGSFCITGVIGAGGMGRVYVAEHIRLPKRFAVKVPHEHFASHREAMARFEREAQTIARVGNEHVIDVVDIVRLKDGRPCMVTELLKGEDLGSLLDQVGKLPLPTAITISRQVCRGLAAAHATGVVHRDLKPSNLFLVRREGGSVHVKILDFGVAKVLDGADLTRTGSVVGTPQYMAPEQARGSAEVDSRADIYAVGAVLYRMLTGERPFPEEEPTRTMIRLLTEDPRRPRDIDKTIPEGLEALIQRAMARTREDRPPSAQELDRQLADFDMQDPLGPARSFGLSTAVTEGAPNDEIATVVIPNAQGQNAADDVTRKARRARPVAVLLSIAMSLAAGAAVFTSAAMVLRMVYGITERRALNETEILIAGGVAGALSLFAFIGTIRVLVGRWRSAPAMERLGKGLLAAMMWLFISCGVLALGAAAYNAFALPIPALGLGPADWLGWISVGVVALPTVIALVALVVGLRRVTRVS